MNSINLNDFESTVFKLTNNDIKLNDLENWIYNYQDIEKYISYDDYIDLISLDYKSKYAYLEVFNIIDKYIDYGRFEELKLLELLNKCLDNDTHYTILAAIFQEFYYLYCRGYSFLGDLGISYGLACVVPLSKYSSNEWDELKEYEKEETINSFYPNVIKHLNRISKLLISKEIILTGIKDQRDNFTFIDNRN